VADGGLIDAADPAPDVLPAVSELGAAAEVGSSGAAVVVGECLEEQPVSIDSTTIASTLTAGAETFMVAHRPSIAECLTPS
jgi:hypothetical protein